jgi:high affinity sulfate transporter 1
VAASAVAVAGITAIDQVASFVALVTLISGALFILVAVLKLGRIAQFLSRAVVTGFLFGAGLDVAIGELPKITGTDASGSNAIAELWSWLGTLGDSHTTSVVVGVVAMLAVFGLRAVAPRIPGALVLLVGGLLATWAFDLQAMGVALVGDIPRGLPSLEVPDLALLSEHALTTSAAAVALVLIGFSQTAGDARAFAGKHRYQIDLDQECLAQGAANIGAGIFQGMPVSTSLSASALNDHSGARSGLASLITGAIVLLTLLLLAPLFSGLPQPVLAALIIEAVVMGMMDLPEMRRLRKVKPFDFWIAVGAITGTLLFGVFAGVMIGIGLSLLWLVSVATRPPMPLLGRDPDTKVFRELDEDPRREEIPGVAVLRLDGGLFFATSDALVDRMREVAVDRPDVRTIVLNCEGIHFIDSQGSARIREIIERAESSGRVLLLARVKPEVRSVLERDGVMDLIGADRIHETVISAVESI